MTASEVVDHVSKNWRYPYFLKTFAKNASMEIRNEDNLQEFHTQIKRDEDVYDSTGYIVSELMDINIDARGKREFRAYIIGGEVVNISRNIIDTGTGVVSGREGLDSEQVQIFCHGFALNHSDTFQTYVLDVAECEDGGFRIVELNDFCYSGRFEKNDFGAILGRFMAL